MMNRDTTLSHLTSIPIPTYEEATSRPSSSQHNLGPTETSHDAQRQHLLRGSRRGYRPPTVEAARDSMDSEGSDLSVPDMVHDEQHERTNLEELDYLEPGQSETVDRRQARQYHRTRLRNKFTQQLNNLSATLGALRIPSLRRSYTAVPPLTDTNLDRQEPVETWRSRFGRNLRIPEQYRMSMPTFARLCALLTIAGLVWFLFTLNFFPRRRNLMGTMFEPESVREFVQDHVNGYRIRGWLDHLSSFAHEAGSEGSYYLANWMSTEWSANCELDEEALLEYKIMASYPTAGGRWVKATIPGQDTWTASLEEDSLDFTRQQTLAWHAYSANGKVQGPLIYANHGSREDYTYLHDNGIATRDTIALVSVDAHHQPQDTGLKVRFAEEAGCVGVLVFNGDIVNRPDLQPWPESALPGNDSVHRAHALLSNWLLGDPLTPGYASSKGTRKDPDAAAAVMPAIPSLPLSWRDAAFLLSQLNDRGTRVPMGWLLPDSWTGGDAGTSVKTMEVTMQNENDFTETQPIWQVQARIEGAEASRMKVIVGAPRDSWCFGASHSASASAILTEIVAVFGELRKYGWRPLRSVEFVSWDASTFNAAGSTEYVEGNIDALREDAVAYLNVGSGISGHHFHASGSPMLQRILKHAMNRVTAPGTNQTMKEVYDSDEASSISPLAPTPELTDASPFTYIAGVPSLDMGFVGEEGKWVSGSCYDSFQWLQSTVDSADDLEYHKALAQVWILAIIELVSTPLLPLDSRAYAEDFAAKVEVFEKEVLDLVASEGPGQTLEALGMDLTSLRDAVTSLREASTSFHAFEDLWTTQVLAQGGLEDLYQNRQRLGWNFQILQFEKAMIDLQQHKDDGTPGGLRDRPQFRHILVAPQKWSNGTQSLPTIWDYLEGQEWEKAGSEIDRIAAMVDAAAEPLSTGW